MTNERRRGYYSSGKRVEDLRRPPSGPAPGAPRIVHPLQPEHPVIHDLQQPRRTPEETTALLASMFGRPRWRWLPARLASSRLLRRWLWTPLPSPLVPGVSHWSSFEVDEQYVKAMRDRMFGWDR